jgi:hypothetical protein
MTSDRRLLSLALALLALGGVAAVAAPIEIRTASGLVHILIVPLLALALCQAFLVALWGTAATAAPWLRFAGLVAGAVYLDALLPPDLRHETLGMSTLTIVVTTATLLVVRTRGVRLRRPAGPVQPARPEAEGLRFSIRGLMLFTAGVALLSAGARALQESPRRMLLLIVVWSLCFVAVGMVGLWAALGNARPLRRGPVVLALSPVLGAFFAYAAGAHQAGCVYIILIMLLYPAALLGSLLVVRSCGYRLGRVAGPVPASRDGEGQGDGP